MDQKQANSVKAGRRASLGLGMMAGSMQAQPLAGLAPAAPTRSVPSGGRRASISMASLLAPVKEGGEGDRSAGDGQIELLMNLAKEREGKIKALNAQIIALSAGSDGIRESLTERDARVRVRGELYFTFC